MIHILTLSWNGCDKLKILYNGLKNSIEPTGQSAIWHIRDNGSNDGTVEWLQFQEKHWKDYNFEVSPMYVNHNRDNFSQGVNSLFEKAVPIDDDYILLLNNDIVFGDYVSLYNMIRLMDDSKIGVVGARLLYSGTNKLQHAGVIFSNRYNNLPYHYRHQEESDNNAEKNRYFQAVTAACCLVRASDFVKFDQFFNWAFEDIDFILRIGKKKKIAYCGQTKIFHEESASLKRNPINKLFLQPNVKRFKEKWFDKYVIDHEKYLKTPNHMLIK